MQVVREVIRCPADGVGSREVDVNRGVKTGNRAVEDALLEAEGVKGEGIDVLALFEEAILLINGFPDPAGGLPSVPCAAAGAS